MVVATMRLSCFLERTKAKAGKWLEVELCGCWAVWCSSLSVAHGASNPHLALKHIVWPTPVAVSLPKQPYKLGYKMRWGRSLFIETWLDCAFIFHICNLPVPKLSTFKAHWISFTCNWGKRSLDLDFPLDCVAVGNARKTGWSFFSCLAPSCHSKHINFSFFKT